MFHLEKFQEDEGGRREVSNSAIPRHESPIIKGISRVHESMELPLGDICVTPSRRAINDLARAAYASDMETLISNIRLCCQYKVNASGRMLHLVIDEREQLKHWLVEDTISILDKTYPSEKNYLKYTDWPALRKNGMFAVVHPLQVMAGVAAIEAPLNPDDRLSLAPVVLGGLHDVLEDVEDKSEAMKDVKFRIARKGKDAEVVGRRKMLDYLFDLYSEYSDQLAKRIAKDLVLLTRGSLPEGMPKEKYYVDIYLRRLYQDLFCAKVKAEDFHSNSMAIKDVGDEHEMLRLAQSLIPKGLPQVLAWKKLAWVEYHRLLARLEYLFSLFNKEAECQRIMNEIMAPSQADLRNFEAGFVCAGSRRFTYNIMATMPPAGSPVLIHYQSMRKDEKTGQKKLVNEIEIPFCRNLNQAKDIIMNGFHDVTDQDIVQSPNLIQKRLGSGAIYSFDAKEKWNVQKRMAVCRKKYDAMLRQGAMGHAFAGFERGAFAREAERKWGPAIAAGSKRIERFKFYKVQVH